MKVLWFVNIPILGINDRYGWTSKGSGWWLTTLAKALSNVSNISLGVANCSRRYSKYDKFKDANITYYCYPQTIQSVLELSHKLELERSYNIIQDFQPELIDVHGTEYFYGLISEAVNVPVIITLQGVLNDIIPVYFADQGISKVLFKQLRCFKDIKSSLGMIWSYINTKQRARTERKIFKDNKYFIGRTDWDHSCQQRFSSGSKYYYCHRILRDNFYRNVRDLNKRTARRIFCISAGSVYKGAHTLIEATERLVDEFPDIFVRIAGNINRTGWGGHLHRLVKKKSLEKNVTFIGYLSDQQIVEECLNANIFVAPSFIENECIALAEAMMIGTPCVVSASGGMTSTIHDGHDGLLYKKGNAEDLAKTIKLLLKDENLCQKLGRNARETALERHNPETIVTSVLDIYRDVLKECGIDQISQ